MSVEVEDESADAYETRRSATFQSLSNLRRFLAKKDKTRLDLLTGILQWGHRDNITEPVEERIHAEGPKDEIASADLAALVESTLVAEWVARVNGLDATSKLLVGAYDEEKQADAYDEYNPNIWIRGLEGPRKKNGLPMMGHFGHIGGEGLGRGKTSFGVRLAKIAAEKGYHIISNVRMTPPPELEERVHFVARMSDLLRAAIHAKKTGGHSIAILDESLFVFGRQDAMTKEWRDFDKFIRWVRKLHMSLVFITHSFARDVPEKFKPFITSRFEKPALKSLVATIRTDHYHLEKRVRKVPDAEWAYDDEGRGGLEADVDIQALHDYLTANATSGVDEDDLTLRYLDNPPPPRPRDASDEHALPGRPSQREAHLETVLEHRSEFQRPDGSWDLTAIMDALGISRPTAREVADLATRRLRTGA